MMKLRGKAHKFGNDINTDCIIAGKYKFKTLDMRELAKHVLEDLDPDFYRKIKKGDFIVAGRDFGCGSSREQAPRAIKYAGISGIIAKSFAPLFYRNAINIGLPVVECSTDSIKAGDELEIDLEEGVIYNRSKKKRIKIEPLSRFMIEILRDGGLAAHLKKHSTLKL